jgi:hypothetical protein
MKLSPVASLDSFLADGELVAFDVGPNDFVYMVVALSALDYQVEQPGWAAFPKTVPEQPQKYRVVALSGNATVLDIVIEQERFNIYHVQPLGNELLLVCSRSYCSGGDGPERNGRVYTREGKFVRDVLLGDGIKSVQTTSNEIIWTSFFDEGVFGNFGWQDPIGASGLVAWDRTGNKLYQFEPVEGLEPIYDCYALNVQSNEDVWFYYYNQFPLVHLRRNKIDSFWEIPIGGSDAFAISGRHALFRGGYNERDVYRLFSLEDDRKAKLVNRVEPKDEAGNLVAANRAIGRAGAIHLISGRELFRIDIETVMAVQ